MLEEERHALGEALITDLDRPFEMQRTSTRAALAAEDHPVDAGEIDGAKRAEERLYREKAQTCLRMAEMVDACRSREKR